MKSIGIAKFKATCLKVLKDVKESGKPLLVTKRGEPIAQVIPPPAPDRPRSWLGCMRDSGKIVGNVIKPAVAPSEWEAHRK
ncbi:MAG TPA: type II toxin-antitoxin system Phd/YefM family antitoxin [Acidobacteriota bacterium]|jgi:prevent-host-death family protein|nr:type II toxin-antitoxin system Phd/YefM family antitoxin [Acidobacteriota bacterium]